MQAVAIWHVSACRSLQLLTCRPPPPPTHTTATAATPPCCICHSRHLLLASPFLASPSLASSSLASPTYPALSPPPLPPPPFPSCVTLNNGAKVIVSAVFYFASARQSSDKLAFAGIHVDDGKVVLVRGGDIHHGAYSNGIHATVFMMAISPTSCNTATHTHNRVLERRPALG